MSHDTSGNDMRRTDPLVEPQPAADPPPHRDEDPADDGLQPLAGEPGIPDVNAPARAGVSRKGLLAVGLLIASLAVVAGVSIHRLASGSKKADDATPDRVAQRPAASSELRHLDMTPGAPQAASAASAPGPRIPALQPDPDGSAEPIPVRRTGPNATPTSGGTRPVLPEDAPVLLVSTTPGAVPHRSASPDGGPLPAGGDTGAPPPAGGDNTLEDTRRNLQAYQRQLQGLLDSLARTAAAASGQGQMPGQNTAPVYTPPLVPPVGMPPTAGTPADAPSGGGLFGGQLQGSATARVMAGQLANRSLTLPKGTSFTCALKTRVISATSGLVGCQVQRNVYSEDGRVLLIERGSHLDGEYRIASVRPGMVRIPVLWTRIRTPNAVTVDIDSPATGPLGESGVEGHVDNRWPERIGAAMLLSLIDDSVKLIIQNQASQGGGAGDTIVLPSTTANTSKLAEKVLDSTINIPPLVYQNQGGIVGIYVAHDLDFSSVYALQPTERGAQP